MLSNNTTLLIDSIGNTQWIIKATVPAHTFYFILHLILRSYEYNKHVGGLLHANSVYSYYIKLTTSFSI